MKWLLYNFILAATGTWLIVTETTVRYQEPLIFLGIFGSVFIFIWLTTYLFNRNYFFKMIKLMQFVAYITKELFLSNLRVAYDVLTPRPRMRPAIIAIPLDASTDIEIVALATLITFTPGTLTLKVSDDRKTLYIHEMYIQNNNTEAAKKKIKEGYERRILELTR